jgi:type IV secretory pathway TraG/TraD family ATPase VirD4
MDELPSLYELPSLKEVLAEGRKYGACFVATIQDLHQLRTIYGREATEALLACFNTTLCFRTGSTESANWAEHYFGCQEVIEMREGFSYGANDMRDGVTLNQERRKNSVIMSSEFAKLDNLEAYLKLPGNFPITKLKFNYQGKPDIADPLVARAMQDLLMLVVKDDNKLQIENSDKTKIIPKNVTDTVATVTALSQNKIEFVPEPFDY